MEEELVEGPTYIVRRRGDLVQPPLRWLITLRGEPISRWYGSPNFVVL